MINTDRRDLQKSKKINKNVLAHQCLQVSQSCTDLICKNQKSRNSFLHYQYVVPPSHQVCFMDSVEEGIHPGSRITKLPAINHTIIFKQQIVDWADFDRGALAKELRSGGESNLEFASPLIIRLCVDIFDKFENKLLKNIGSFQFGSQPFCVHMECVIVWRGCHSFQK